MLSKYLKITQINLINKHCRRSFWGWLNTISNKVDQSRIDAVGAEVAAAEWLIRNGAAVKWSYTEKWMSDYNLLPKEKQKSNEREYSIVEIDATDSSIMSIGFPHLKDLKHVKKFIIKRNHYLDDDALPQLTLLKNSLEHFELISCSGVTDDGLLSLTNLSKLKYLKLFDLLGVKDRKKCLQHLTLSLSNCNIDWPESDL